MALNVKKQEFILQYILSARASGRSRDIGDASEQIDLVRTAEALYDRVLNLCTVPDAPDEP